MNNYEISFQIYTARYFKPYQKIFEFISNSGISNIELFEVEAFDETKDLLQEYNLTSLSSHIGFSELKNTENIINKLKFIGVKHAIVPAPEILPGTEFKDNFNKSEKEWNDFGKKLSSYVKIFEDNGLTLGYHNHAFEYKKLESGKMPLECVLDHNENLKFEIDIGWTVAGLQDPIHWIKKYSNKIISCHLKDFFEGTIDFQDHNKQSAIGEGIINWSNILTEVKKTNCEIFALEHDNPLDYKDYISKSIKFLNTL
tara:strand:+ start:619 stop:1386 length:768 start_codon:yes stop_codon:yes gene_type:complete